MKLQWVVAVVAVALIANATGAFAAKIVVENEHYKSIKPSMELRTDSKASGGKCIERPLKRPHAASESAPSDTGNAEYEINVPSTGTYQFWGRCWWWDACGNSFYVLLDATTVTSKTPYITDQTFKKWHWVAGPTLRLTKGVHKIRVQYREDGARMDQFLLTTTPKNRWEPSRIERETPQYIVK